MSQAHISWKHVGFFLDSVKVVLFQTDIYSIVDSTVANSQNTFFLKPVGQELVWLKFNIKHPKNVTCMYVKDIEWKKKCLEKKH